MNRKNLVFAGAAIIAACSIFSASTAFADGGDKVIEDFMKKYHKAPTGTDPVCKKVNNGQASDAELAELLKGYQTICGCKPPKGDVAAWQTKCKAIVAAVKQIQAKDAGGVDAYKKAVSCKGCHSEHKAD